MSSYVATALPSMGPQTGAIVIPARYASSRLPAKPLCDLDGKTMLQRVLEVGLAALVDLPDTMVVLAVDHPEVEAHAQHLRWLQPDAPIAVVMTEADCPSGTDRCYQALRRLDWRGGPMVNLQGDAPLTDPRLMVQMLQYLRDHPEAGVVTPVVRLPWDVLDRLRENKKVNPFSGTTAIVGRDGRALWFSKQIIPAIRDEDRSQPWSPVWRHIGAYGYHFACLERYVTYPPSTYEKLEGLEQLRLLENGESVFVVEASEVSAAGLSGVDTERDRQAVVAYLRDRASRGEGV
jgi:3-deoxy-manno-octulosonate cytidylyltransferase (CMP-KDO synthetase)